MKKAVFIILVSIVLACSQSENEEFTIAPYTVKVTSDYPLKIEREITYLNNQKNSNGTNAPYKLYIKDIFISSISFQMNMDNSNTYEYKLVNKSNNETIYSGFFKPLNKNTHTIEMNKPFCSGGTFKSDCKNEKMKLIITDQFGNITTITE